MANPVSSIPLGDTTAVGGTKPGKPKKATPAPNWLQFMSELLSRIQMPTVPQPRTKSEPFLRGKDLDAP